MPSIAARPRSHGRCLIPSGSLRSAVLAQHGLLSAMGGKRTLLQGLLGLTHLPIDLGDGHSNALIVSNGNVVAVKFLGPH